MNAEGAPYINISLKPPHQKGTIIFPPSIIIIHVILSPAITTNIVSFSFVCDGVPESCLSSSTINTLPVHAEAPEA